MTVLAWFRRAGTTALVVMNESSVLDVASTRENDPEQTILGLAAAYAPRVLVAEVEQDLPEIARRARALPLARAKELLLGQEGASHTALATYMLTAYPELTSLVPLLPSGKPQMSDRRRTALLFAAAIGAAAIRQAPSLTRYTHEKEHRTHETRKAPRRPL